MNYNEFYCTLLSLGKFCILMYNILLYYFCFNFEMFGQELKLDYTDQHITDDIWADFCEDLSVVYVIFSLP